MSAERSAVNCSGPPAPTKPRTSWSARSGADGQPPTISTARQPDRQGPGEHGEGQEAHERPHRPPPRAGVTEGVEGGAVAHQQSQPEDGQGRRRGLGLDHVQHDGDGQERDGSPPRPHLAALEGVPEDDEEHAGHHGGCCRRVGQRTGQQLREQVQPDLPAVQQPREQVHRPHEVGEVAEQARGPRCGVGLGGGVRAGGRPAGHRLPPRSSDIASARVAGSRS